MRPENRLYATRGFRSGLSKVLLFSVIFLIAAVFAASQDVLTQHNDNARTGQNLSETILTPSNVNSATFGRLFTLSVDGKVDAQPLYMSALAIPNNGTHNVLIVATEHDTVYAFDADTGTKLWSVSLLGSGETTSDNHGCNNLTPEIGVTATPVIDRSRGAHGAIYVVAMSKDSSGNYHQRLHALDAATGTELLAGPMEITATYPGSGDNSSGGNVIFAPGQYMDRTGLLLLNGVVYTTWSSHCDITPYTGWIMGYNASTLAQASVLNIVPNGSQGAIWMAGAGPAADNAGNIYLLAGNGDFDATLNSNSFPSSGDYGNAFLKLSTSSGLAVADYFEMDSEATENTGDRDLGSGGTLVLPDQSDSSGKVWHLAVGAGKDGNLYVVNRDAMGKFNASSNNIYQQLTDVFPNGIFSGPAYFNGTLYYGANGDPIFAFQVSNAKLSTSAVAQTSNSFGYPGASPSISANQTANAIVWASQNTNPAVLHAYAAGTLQELYNSNQAANSRDQFGAGNKYITPTIANGKVYVGTTNSVGVFGLLNAPAAAPVPSPPTNDSTPTPALSASAPGSIINYGSGFTAAGMQLNGRSSLNGTRLRLTDTATTNEAGSAFFTTPVNVQSFTSDFSFQLTSANADGMAFVIQNNGATALGPVGGGLGYGPDSAGAPANAGLNRSVAIKFDLYSNSGEGGDSTGLYSDGASPTTPALGLTGSGVNLHSGDIFNVHLSYDGTTLTMTITDASNPSQTFTSGWPINIPALVGGNTALVGFTGGTGGLTATQEILSWTYKVTNSSPPPPPPPPPAHSITFSWGLPAGPVTGYNILCGSQSGGPYSVLNSALISAPPYKDVNAQAGQTYYCVAESVLDNLYSVYSNEIKITIPNP